MHEFFLYIYNYVITGKINKISNIRSLPLSCTGKSKHSEDLLGSVLEFQRTLFCCFINKNKKETRSLIKKLILFRMLFNPSPVEFYFNTLLSLCYLDASCIIIKEDN